MMADPPPTDAPANGSAPPSETIAPAVAAAAPPGLGPKRQRRPSVRLGDIGEQPAGAAGPHDPYARRGGKQWRISSQQPLAHPHRDSSSSAGGVGGGVGKIPSRTRPLTNLVWDEPLDAVDVTAAAEDQSFYQGEENLESAIGVRRGGREGKGRRGGGPRRVKTNWMSKADEGVDGTELKSSGEDAGDEGYREYDDMRPEDSESPMKEHSPSNRWLPNLGRRLPVTLAQSGGNMFSKESKEVCPATTAEAMEADVLVERDVREWSRGRGHLGEDGGVRAWLNGLGLGQYAPVFEIHEVDSEVLPLLTLEDLKDMGINAVGSRRKMYFAIQKLRKSLS